jgi:Uncharacterised nucleotidyltransferase
VSAPPLVRLLRALPGEVTSVAASLSASEWERVPTDAERHGLSGLLVDALARSTRPVGLAQGERGGERHLARLRAQARNSAAHAMKLHRLLLDTLALLEPRGLEPVLMKGWGFASRYWPDPLLRPASDVDLLVEPEALPGVERAMAKLGLRQVQDPGEDDVFEHHHHLSFHGPRGLVELHFRLLTNFGGAQLGDAAVFARCRRATLEGHAVRYLAPEDELVYLAAHAAGHLFLRLSWLHDVKLLVAKEKLDWDRVVALATQSALRASTHAGLFLAAEVLGAQIPPKVLSGLAPTRLHARAVRRAFTDEALVSAKLATAKSASATRALLSDDPLRAARHLAEGVVRKVKRRVRTGGVK